MSSRWLLCFKYLLLLLFVCFNTSLAFAGPSRTTYQARIVKPDGFPLESANVSFKFTILDPVGTCALFSETYSNVSMASSSGLISFSLGTGIKTFPVSGTTFEQVFSNITPFLACDAGGPANYTPGANDIRKIVMQFNDGAGWQTLPAMSINAVPYAMYANDSQTLQGKLPSDFVQVTSLPTCTASQALFFNGSSFSCVAAGGVGGSVTSSTITTALGYTPADGASVTTVTSSVASANSNIALVSSTVFAVSATLTSLTSSVAASFAAITSSQWSTSGTSLFYISGNVGVGTSNPVSRLDVGGWPEAPAGLSTGANIASNLYVGNTGSGVARVRLSSNVNGGFMQWNRLLTTSGAIQTDPTKPSFSLEMNGTTDRVVFQRSAASSTTLLDLMSITGSGRVGIGTSSPVATLEVSGGVRIGADSTSCASVNAGTLRYNAGVVEYCNGTTWAAFGVSGAGILALNGLTSGSQTIAVGTSGLSPNVSSTGTTHTFNFPLASAASVTAGLISNSDYINFNSKASGASLTAINANLSAVSSAVTSLTNSSAASYALLNSNINSVSTSVTTLFASMSSIVASQWTTSGTTLNYMTGNVGIGTTTPISLLQVSGTARLSNVLIGDGAWNAPSIAFANNPSSGFFNAGGYIGFSVNGALRAQLNSSSFSFNSGGAGPQLYFTGGSAANPSYAFNVDSDTGMFNPNAGGGSNELGFSTGGIERLRIASTGAVGIGFFSPNALLHLASGTSTTASFKLTSGTLLASPASGAIEYDGSYLYFTDDTNTRKVIATGVGVTSSSIISALGYSPVSAAAASPWVTSGTSLGYASGRVGVGTTNPQYNLDVNGTFRVTASATVYSASTWGSSSVNSYYSGSDQNGELWSIGIRPPSYPDGSLAIATHYGTMPITFKINNVEKVRLDSTGNLGVGTSSPTNTLEVAGAGLTVTRNQTFGTLATFRKAFTATSNESPYIELRQQTVSGGTFDRYGYIQAGDGWDGMLLQGQNPSGYSSLILNKMGGNVGVGTVSPTAKFEVAGNSNITSETTTYATMTIEDTEGQLDIITPSAGNWGSAVNFVETSQTTKTIQNVWSIYREASEAGNSSLHFKYGTNKTVGNNPSRLTITTGGNVGINMASATNTLTVSNTQIFNPSANVSSAIMIGPTAGQNFGGGILMKDFTYYGGMWMNGSGAVLSFAAGGTSSGFSNINALNVTSAGVGVGMTSPTEKLEVNGNIKVSGEVYSTRSWGFKKGPTAFSANYINTYGAGYHVGSSLDCTSSATGCSILKAGTYEIKCTQRGGTTTSTFVGVALNGDRTALESRADAMWEHDHTITPGGFTQSTFVGTLSVGNFITCGPANVTTSADLSYGASSYIGTLYIKRID